MFQLKRSTINALVHSKRYFSFLNKLSLNFNTQLTEDEQLIQETAKQYLAFGCEENLLSIYFINILYSNNQFMDTK